MHGWWLMWMVVMFAFFVTPIGYGWGYRGWGPPYPRYIQRRRGQQAIATGGTATGGTVDHHAWGWGGDLLWAVMLVGLMWVLAAFWWPLWWH